MSGSSAAANEETKHSIRGMFGERTDQFQLLKLERTGRGGGHCDPWYFCRSQPSSSYHPGSLFPIDIKRNRKVEVRKSISEHEGEFLS
jgi:hypothetical protein